MKKEDLIIKWLNNEPLTKEELEAFKKLDAYDSYVRITENAIHFKAPDYNPDDSILLLKNNISTRQQGTKSIAISTVLFRIAAVFILTAGIYFSFFKEYNTHIATLATEKRAIELPDHSVVELNSVSSITYNKKNWEEEKKINLEGEAFFKVATGKKFDVHTASGIISVIGTQFNVKQRETYLEVTCYEGVVSVVHFNDITYLEAGDILEVSDKNSSKKKIATIIAPQWLHGRSLFYSTPYKKVLQEFAWQYGVNITTKNIDKTMLFTGNFVHSDIKTALQSITIPMHVTYVINNKDVTLYKE